MKGGGGYSRLTVLIAVLYWGNTKVFLVYGNSLLCLLSVTVTMLSGREASMVLELAVEWGGAVEAAGDADLVDRFVRVDH